MKSLITATCLFAIGSLGITLHAKPFNLETVRSTSNQIDQLVASHLQQKKIKANPIIADSTFARRAFITIAGRIPTADEARTFIASTEKDKRTAIVDGLIESNGYKSQMFNFWANLLRVNTNMDKHGLGWHVWIRDAVEQNMPYDQFVNSMLSSNGLATENPAVGYYLRDRNMLLDNVSNTVQVFLGTQIGCAQCHDHPFDDWTQKQYYQLAAFTGSTVYKSDTADHLLRRLALHTLDEQGVPKFKVGADRKANKKAMAKRRTAAKKLYRDYASLFRDFRKIAIGEDPSKPLRLPKDYQYNDGKPGDILSPKTLFGKSMTDIAPEKRRKVFADWVTEPKNPYFTKVIVNRLWAQAFGRGIVEPIDDWSETTRVSHPELLDYLCEIMKDTGYDVKQFMRVLYHTRLFESAVATTEPNMGGAYDFRGPILRRMKAEELNDSFITMEFGNRDSTVNHALKSRWEKYTKSVDTLFNMDLPELIALDEAADEMGKKVYAIRADARKHRRQAEKARSEGNTKLAKELNKKANTIFRSGKRMEKESKNGMMSMMMERTMRTKPTPYMRASEQASPSKPGTFMRQFGASDRMTPDAHHGVLPKT